MPQASPAYQDLPSVAALLEQPFAKELQRRWGRTLTTEALRQALSEARGAMAQGSPVPGANALLIAAKGALEGRTPRGPRPVLNLTGTLLHTNLGRAVLSPEAREAMVVAAGAVDLELDLATGRRGQRDQATEALLCALTGAEAAAVVNNNAAAVLLVLNTFGLGKEVLVSRGELVEIGGSFRIPDIMVRAGATLREVGTTNRTHERDYAQALEPNAGLLMKVHPSNYAIEGYTSEVSLKALAALGKRHGVPTAFDLGAGSLVDLRRYGLPAEPQPQEAIAAGIDLVTFSADKLLGGPQAGLIVGTKDAIAAVRANPLYRALRVDKVRLAALRATLLAWDQPEPEAQLPTLAQLLRPETEIRRLAEALAPAVAARLGEGWSVAVISLESQIGSGAQPTTRLPSAGLALRPSGPTGRALEHLARSLRALPTPVLGRITQDALVLDLRTLSNAETLLAALGEHPLAP
jgi:L-seryl-tRNA(Ser) seleniumtransferase